MCVGEHNGCSIVITSAIPLESHHRCPSDHPPANFHAPIPTALRPKFQIYCPGPPTSRLYQSLHIPARVAGLISAHDDPFQVQSRDRSTNVECDEQRD